MKHDEHLMMMYCTETLLWKCVGVCGTARAVFVLSSSALVLLGGNIEEAPEHPEPSAPPLSADFTPLLYYGVYCSTSSQTPAGEKSTGTSRCSTQILHLTNHCR